MNAILGTDFFKVTFIIVTLAVSNDGLTLGAVLFINETSPSDFSIIWKSCVSPNKTKLEKGTCEYKNYLKLWYSQWSLLMKMGPHSLLCTSPTGGLSQQLEWLVHSNN